MAITKQKKSEILKKVEEIAKGAKSIAFVHFKGLTVADTTAMRKALRVAGVGYTVAKKTLVRKALEAKKFEGEMPALEGEIALVYGEDLVAPAREVQQFAKKFKENLAIVGGVFDGVFKGKAEMMEIASIPPTQVLYGQFVNLINSPIQRFAVVLSEIAKTKPAQ